MTREIVLSTQEQLLAEGFFRNQDHYLNRWKPTRYNLLALVSFVP